MKNLFFLLCLVASFFLNAQSNLITPFEENPDATCTYQECISFYKKLSIQNPAVAISRIGITDSGLPLHLIVVAKDNHFDPSSVKAADKRIIFINNGIHPGEPDGIDATMMWIRDLVEDPARSVLLDNTVLVIIPIYNVGGSLNRDSFSRANQNGPRAYGFRGNAKNLDLNRDFIKCDSKNAQAFAQAYTMWQPDVFVDNHTSNGADYQYTMTLLATQKDKLARPVSNYMVHEMLPRLYEDMEARNWEMCPYVHARGTPDEGIMGFLDHPRYASGFSTLHHALGFTVETHMLKPFKDRVWATYHFMDVLLGVVAEDADKIGKVREQVFQEVRAQKNFDLDWELDVTNKTKLNFKGYEAKYKTSEVTGLERLYYDRSMPYEKEIPFMNSFKSTLKVEKPVAYIIPQAYEDVINRLQWNGVEMQKLRNDSTFQVVMYRIKDYKSTDFPYEGHYLHYDVQVEKEVKTQTFYRGDYLIKTGQSADRFIVETLEPEAPDSYLAWNFFDGIFMQKEYFSSYVFEDLAAAILKENPEVRTELEAKKSADEAFAKNARAQLDFVYKRSPYYENTHLLYPIARLESEK